MSTLPDVSVIISSRNRPRLLVDAVRSVLAGGEVPAEIVVVDQSGRDNAELMRLAREHDGCLVYVRQAGLGVSRGRNEGVRKAREPIVAFIDDDCVAGPDWLATLVGAVRRAGPRTVITGQVVPGSSEALGGFAPSVTSSEHAASYVGRIGRDVLYTGNMACYRSVLLEIGLFDERLGAGSRFGGAEDNDLGHRLLEAGFGISYVPDAIVTHRAWRGRSAFIRVRWSYGRGQGAFFAKHLSSRDSYMAGRLAASVRDHLGRVPSQMRRDRREATGNIVYVLGLVSGAVEWLITRGRGL